MILKKLFIKKTIILILLFTFIKISATNLLITGYLQNQSFIKVQYSNRLLNSSLNKGIDTIITLNTKTKDPNFSKINTQNKTQVVFCGVEEWNPTLVYATNGTKVYYDCKIWKSVNYVNSGVTPGTSWVWYYESDCNESVTCTEPDYGYCGVPNYYHTNIYPTAGTLVYYDFKLYESNNYVNSEQIPGISTLWTYVEPCSDPMASGRTLGYEDEELKKDISLYYYKQTIYFDFSNLETISELICYDTKGSIIFKEKVLNSKSTIGLPLIKQGIYIIQILNNNAQTFKKIIVL